MSSHLHNVSIFLFSLSQTCCFSWQNNSSIAKNPWSVHQNAHEKSAYSYSKDILCSFHFFAFSQCRINYLTISLSSFFFSCSHEKFENTKPFRYHFKKKSLNIISWQYFWNATLISDPDLLPTHSMHNNMLYYLYLFP